MFKANLNYVLCILLRQVSLKLRALNDQEDLRATPEENVDMKISY